MGLEINNLFFLLSFSRQRGALGKMLFGSWHCGFPTFPKNIPVFWELFFHRSTNQDKPIRMMGTKQGGQSVLNGILLIWSGYYAGSIWRNGELQYRTLSLKLPASSTPPFRVRVFSFLIPPPSFFRQPSLHPAAVSYSGYTWKLLIASIFRYPVRRGPEESKEDNRCERDTGKRLIDPIRFFYWWIMSTLVFFKMVDGSLGKMLFASWECGFQTFQKTSVFFGSYLCSTLKRKKSPPGRRARSKADNPFWMVFFNVIQLICLLSCIQPLSG